MSRQYLRIRSYARSSVFDCASHLSPNLRRKVFSAVGWLDCGNHARRKRNSATRLSGAVFRGQRREQAVTVVYDNLVSPPTIGDFLLVVLLARYFAFQPARTQFIIIEGEERQDWKDLSADLRAGLVEAQAQLLAQLLDNAHTTVKRMGWQEASAVLSQDNEALVIGADLVKSRQPIYNHAFNLLNNLMAASLEPPQNYLLTASDFGSDDPLRSQSNGYVALHARYSVSWGLERNLSPENLVRISKFLRDSYPDLAIVIVSDSAGCEYFRTHSDQHNLDLLFSKDFSRSFSGDCEIILRSELYLQFRGGGIGVIPMFSDHPYVIVDPAANETPWSSKKFCSWSTDQQIRINTAAEIDDLMEACGRIYPTARQLARILHQGERPDRGRGA